MKKKTFHSYYELLQVPQNASAEQIHAAYRMMVKKFHPDMHPKNRSVAEQRLYLINEAYEKLKRPESRRQYDLRLTAKRKVRLAQPENDNNKKVQAFPWTDVAKVGWSNLTEILWPIAPRPKLKSFKDSKDV